MPTFKSGELVRVTERKHKGMMYHYFRVGQVVRVLHKTATGNYRCTDGELEQSIRPEHLEKFEF